MHCRGRDGGEQHAADREQRDRPWLNLNSRQLIATERVDEWRQHDEQHEPGARWISASPVSTQYPPATTSRIAAGICASAPQCDHRNHREQCDDELNRVDYRRRALARQLNEGAILAWSRAARRRR